MKRSIILLFQAIFCLHLFGQKELEPHLKTATENNTALKAAFAQYRAALEMIPQAKALPDPQVMFQYFITPVVYEMGKQRFNFSASQLFPWFGERSAREQAAVEMAKARYESFIDLRNNLFFEVKSKYYDLYFLHKSIVITNENLNLLRSMRELAMIGFESGKGSFVNVLRADMEIAELENQLAYLKDSEWPLLAEFEKSLNSKIQGSLLFPDTLWKDSLINIKTSILDSIAANNPSLKVLDHEISSWEKQMEAAKKMGYPSFSIGAGYMNMSKRSDSEHPDNGKDMYMFPEIGIMIPLNRKKYNAMVNEARLKGESISFERTNLTNELKSELEMSFRDYLDAERRIILYSRLHKLAKNARDLLLSSFSAAGTEFEEVLRMQEQEIMYALELEEARAMLNTSIAYINYLSGKN